MTSPSVSVVIPVFNNAAYLGEAIESILIQEYHPLELLVVDNGSTDHSAVIASSYPAVRVLRKSHSGIAPTLNHGIRHATGDLLAFLDADDRWLPNKLVLQTASLINNPDLDLVFGHCHQFTVEFENGKTQDIFQGRQRGIAKQGLMIWRKAFLRVGLFAEDGGKHGFLDWYARSREAGLRSLLLDDVVFERRIHDQNTGRTLRAEQRANYLHTLRQSITRRRQQEEVSV